MIKFEWPFFILLVTIPFLVHFFKNKQITVTENTGLMLPFYDDLIKSSLYQTTNDHSTPTNITTILKHLTWFLFIISIMRPIHVGDAIELQLPTHDIMMAIDISGSMMDEDMSETTRQTRLDVVKQIAHQFIQERNLTRMGLVFFGSQAFVSSPLTLDKKSLHSFLTKTQIGFAGQYTAIGDAIGLAIKRLESGNDSNNTRFIILLSDGSNTSGVTDPLESAKIAAKNNIKIYTIGIGKKTKDFFDLQSGRELDETTLREIAKITNGQYFHASDSKTLAKIYNTINKLEPTTKETQIVKPEAELFIYPLVLALLLSIIISIIERKYEHS